MCNKIISFLPREHMRGVLGVVILSVSLSVRLSVTRVDCDKTKWRTADISIPHERAITLLLWHQGWLVGDAPFPLKSALKMTHPLWKMPIKSKYNTWRGVTSNSEPRRLECLHFKSKETLCCHCWRFKRSSYLALSRINRSNRPITTSVAGRISGWYRVH